MSSPGFCSCELFLMHTEASEGCCLWVLFVQLNDYIQMTAPDLFPIQKCHWDIVQGFCDPLEVRSPDLSVVSPGGKWVPFLNFLDIVYWGYFFVGILGRSRSCYLFNLTLGPTQVPIDPFTCVLINLYLFYLKNCSSFQGQGQKESGKYWKYDCLPHFCGQSPWNGTQV